MKISFSVEILLKTFLISYLIYIPFQSKGQKTLFDYSVISAEQGLPSRQIYSIEQSPDGFIWMTGIGEIYRFDGQNFVTYDADFLKVSGKFSIELLISEDNLIWWFEASKDTKTINLFDHNLGHTYSISAFFGAELPESFDEIIAFQRYQGQFIFQSKKGNIFTYKNGKIIEIYQYTKQANCHVAFDDQMTLVFEENRFEVLGKKYNIEQPLPPSFRFINFGGKQGDKIYFQVRDKNIFSYKIYDLERKAFSTLEVLQPSKIQERTSLRVRGDLIWAIQGSRVICMNEKQEILWEDNIKNARGEPIVLFNIFFDKQGNIWLSTFGFGVVKITVRENYFKTYLDNNSLRGIIRVGDELWVNSSDLKRIDLKTSKVTTMLEEVGGTFHRFNDEIWLGTEGNTILKLNTKGEVLKKFRKDGELSSFTMVYYDSLLNTVFIGGVRGLSFMQHEGAIQKHPAPSLKHIAIRQILRNKEGVWVVTSKGIFLLDNDLNIIKQYGEATGLTTNDFNYLYIDEKDIFWIGTKRKGLIRYEPKSNKVDIFRTKEGLSNETIYAIFEDDYNYLWLPSDYGLMRFHKISYTVKTYLPQNGIPHEEFNTFSYYQDNAGNFYFGGVDGLVSLHPKSFMSKEDEFFPFQLIDVSVLESDSRELTSVFDQVKKSNTIVIAPSDKLFEVNFQLLNFREIGNNRYAYKIEGFNDHWNYLNTPTLRITSLPYGNYVLKIKAHSREGTLGNDEIHLNINVLWPFYLRWWFIVGAIGVMIILVYGVIWLRLKQLRKDRQNLEFEVQRRTAQIEKDKQTILSQSEELKKLDRAKTRFFSNITHELRTPLTLIMGPLEQLLKEKSPHRVQRMLEVTHRNAQQLATLINQLLDITKIESHKMKIEVSQGDIVYFTKELVYRFEVLAGQKGQQLSFQTSLESWNTYFDKDKWGKILYNLLSNAIKFTPQNGEIQVEINQLIFDGKAYILLSVIDTGIGIEKEMIDNIFDRFYQIDASLTRVQEGTGIGLALVKELVKLQNGEIQVESEVNQGTTFRIKLPVLSHLEVKETPNQLSTPYIPSGLVASQKEQLSTIETEQLTLLLIEDNADIRMYIRSCIDETHFEIIEAQNGQEGIEKCFEIIPDLVISDIMMPKKDGFEVVKTIRGNFITSHIPIILLTAKASLESRLEGLKRGADVYLTKPFSAEELKIRINKLIEIRQIIQQRYQKEQEISTLTNDSTAYEEEDSFIADLNKFIEEKISEIELNGDLISLHFGISRMQLHRKIKALTGLPTGQYIKKIRLEKAYILLQTSDLNITEIAYAIGFTSVSHFSRTFKSHYNKPPSDVKNTDLN